jgi:hypothetical protein
MSGFLGGALGVAGMTVVSLFFILELDVLHSVIEKRQRDVTAACLKVDSTPYSSDATIVTCRNGIKLRYSEVIKLHMEGE